MIFDADGSSLGIYRKSHIPDGPGYQEKFYFSPGDTVMNFRFQFPSLIFFSIPHFYRQGFKVWKTRYATIGVGICWDQLSTV